MTVEVQRHEKTPLWRNATFLKWLAQIVALIVVIIAFAVLVQQAVTNFNRSGIQFGFGWISAPFGVNIREGIDTAPDSGGRALLVGMVNTLRVAITGIIAATFLGTLVGVSRLSRNWIVNKMATVYIEIIRNIPLLVQIFFWLAVVISRPDLTAGDQGDHWWKFSNKGIGIPWLTVRGGFWPWLAFVIVGIIVGRYVARYRRGVQEATGKPSYSGTAWLLTVVLFAIIGWFAWPVLAFMTPVFHGIADLIDNIPAILFSIAIAVAALAFAALWIRNFFESRRTPAGFGKLTDDDWFRVIFAGVSGVVIAFLAFVIGGFTITTVGGDQATVVELMRTGLSNFFDWLGNSFDPTNRSGPMAIERPAVELRGNSFPQFGTTGMIITPQFFALWIGVTLYTAAFIAEIVRGGILAVSKGQTEAAQAVGLRRSQYLRLVVLPQAFRIILPPVGNQYLNLAKNTSLGIAVAFSDIVQVGQTVYNQTGQSLPVILIWMGFYLTMSLIISGIVNYYNRKMKLVER